MSWLGGEGDKSRSLVDRTHKEGLNAGDADGKETCSVLLECRILVGRAQG